MRVIDPSRPNTHAFIGIGFQERDEAYEFENALRTHDKYAQRQDEIERQKAAWAAQHQDLALKTGQTIQVTWKADPSKAQPKREPRTQGGLTFNFAPPAEGQGFFAPPPTASSPAQLAPTSSNLDWLNSIPMAPASTQPAPAASFDFFSAPPASSAKPAASSGDDWADFSSGSSKNSANDSWANF